MTESGGQSRDGKRGASGRGERGRGGSGARGPAGGGRPSAAHRQGSQPAPLEQAVRSTRNAVRRHAESIRNDQTRLAGRAVLIALHGNLREAVNPGEIIGLVEQVLHVLQAGVKEQAQLPVALRAAAAFVLEEPRRARDVQEELRLVLRHLYTVSADYLPRQVRDDARFRAASTLDVIGEIAREYLPDERFEQVRGAGL